MERADAHFVECSPGVSTTGTAKYITRIEPVYESVQFRDEAYVSGAGGFVYWYGTDWTLLDSANVTSNCGSVFMDADNINTIASSFTGLHLFDSDLNEVSNYFVPNPGWPSSPYWTGAARLSNDGSYVYVAYNGTNPNRGGVFKFDVGTGAQEWLTYGSDLGGTVYFNSEGMAVDSSDNVYVNASITGSGYGVIILDSDGVQTDTTEYIHTMSSVRDIYVDEKLGRIFIGGLIKLSSPYHQLAAYDLDGTNEATFSIGNVQSHFIHCILTVGDYVYCCGTRTASALWDDAYATVWKLDSDLTLQATYDTGGVGSYMCVDLDGNIIVKDRISETMVTLDTDLALVDSDTGQTADWHGSEIQAINYMTDVSDSETPTYWEIYTSDGKVDFTHLIGETVCILADGVVYPSQVVDDNGRIDCSDFPAATKIHIGLNYESKLRPMKPLSHADMMRKKATCKQMGISVHNTDEIEYGVTDDNMKEINFNDVQWTNKCDIDGLFTGIVKVNVPDTFNRDMPLQISTDSPLPCTVRGMIPKVDVTGD